MSGNPETVEMFTIQPNSEIGRHFGTNVHFTPTPDPEPEKEKRYRVPAICVLMHKNGDLFPLAFKEWLPVNLHIWNAFQQQAVAVFRKGFKHYSARTIVHVLRHHSALNESGGEWKINNNHSPSLARLFDLANPHMKGMFEFRSFDGRSND